MSQKPDSLTRPLIHLVLDRPKIAANVAAIVRLSTGLSCALHVSGPLVFDKGDKTKWRAGLDYFQGARVHFHLSLERCLKLLGKDPWLIEVGGSKAPWDVDIQDGDVLILGPEDGSINAEVLKTHKNNILTLPTFGPVRSFNLAQCAAVVAFESSRQHISRDKLPAPKVSQ